MKKITIILAAVFMSLLIFISGCSPKESEYALKVNGNSVPMETYQKKMDAVKAYLEKQGLDFNSEQGKQMLEGVKQDVLEGLISSEIIRQEIESQGWNMDDPAVVEQIENLKTQIKDAGQDYQKWLAEQAMTEEEVIYYMTFTHFLSKDVKVSEEEVRQYFDTYYANYGGQEEQIKARHILLETEDEAKQVITELETTDADFAELAKEKSIEPAAKTNGGDLGYFGRGRMVPEFEEVAFSQEVGVVSEQPVKTDFGYHVILVEDHKPGVKPSFETAKEMVEKDALDYAKNQKVQSYYNELRKAAEIEYAAGINPDTAKG